MKNINESGRSMVEMLGVLAIIGVLSIGGIAGYTMAMNRYRANEVIDAASKIAIANMSRLSGDPVEASEVGIGETVAGVTCTFTAGALASAANTVTISGDCLTNLESTIASIAGTKYNEGTDTFTF